MSNALTGGALALFALGATVCLGIANDSRRFDKRRYLWVLLAGWQVVGFLAIATGALS